MLARASAIASVALLAACADGTVALIAPGPSDRTDAGPQPDVGDASVRDGDAEVDDRQGPWIFDSGPVPDSGDPTISDDCAPGTWCWERPIPGGEPAVGAVVFDRERASYVTASGILAHWDGERWSSRVLDVPCTPRDLWAVDPELVFLSCGSDRGPHYLVRVTRGAVELFEAQGAEFIGELSGTAPDDLWAAGGRRLLRFDGNSLRAVAGPGGDVLLTHVQVLGRDDVRVLESWGSGSGFGRLHRYQAGAWSLEHDFRGFGARVEGPIVSASGGLWLRAYDFDRGVDALAFYDGVEWTRVTPPDRGFSLTAHQAGDRVVVTAGNNGWLRRGGRWVRIADYPGGRPYGRGTDVIWVFGETVARQLDDTGWERWSEGTFAVNGFWSAGGAGATLLGREPAALWRSSNDPRPAEWSASALESVRGPVVAHSPERDGVGWIATEAGLMTVVRDFAQGPIGWPGRMRPSNPMAAGGNRVAIAGQDGLVYVYEGGGGWRDPIPPPAIDLEPPLMPLAGQLEALHLTRDGTLYAGSWVITGDKQVHLAIASYDEGQQAWVPVLRDLGIFGSQPRIVIRGDSDQQLWIMAGMLYQRLGGMTRRIDDAQTMVDFAVAADGHGIGTDGRTIFTWHGTTGARIQELPLPRPATSLFFSLLHRDSAGRTRASTWSAQVLRYTP